MIKLGEKIKSLRKEKNISQEIFANYLGVSFQAVSQFKIALKVIDAFKDDFVETKYFKSTIYEYTQEQRKEIERLLCE